MLRESIILSGLNVGFGVADVLHLTFVTPKLWNHKLLIDIRDIVLEYISIQRNVKSN